MEGVVSWKRPIRKRPNVPTQEQFESIVSDIRSQPLNADHEDSADFVAFLGFAGLGQAEAKALRWGDVALSEKWLRIQRKKTGVFFSVPIYPDLLPLLKDLHQKIGGSPDPTASVFAIGDARKALRSACKRLGMPHFSQRNLRQMKILALLRAGVNPKTVAAWQGHQDGGRLIMTTYSEVISANDSEFAEMELAKYNESTNKKSANAAPSAPRTLESEKSTQ